MSFRRRKKRERIFPLSNSGSSGRNESVRENHHHHHQPSSHSSAHSYLGSIVNLLLVLHFLAVIKKERENKKENEKSSALFQSFTHFMPVNSRGERGGWFESCLMKIYLIFKQFYKLFKINLIYYKRINRYSPQSSNLIRQLQVQNHPLIKIACA